MPRMKLAITVATIAASLVLLNATPSSAVGWTEYTCNAATQNSSAAIETALVSNNVRLHGTCRLDWRRPDPNNNYLRGILVPNSRTLEIAADGTVSLNPGQTLVPQDTTFGDIIRTKDASAQAVVITGAGKIDGNASQQTGLGFDGIQLQNATNSRVSNLRIEDIRGLNAAGGPTESFAVNILSGSVNRVENVRVTTTDAANRNSSSSGIATNHGSSVTIVNSRVSHLRGRCFTSYNTDRVTRTGNIGDDCFAAAYGNEYGAFSLDQNNSYINSSYALALVGETDFTATGMFIAGNTDVAAIHVNGGAPLGPVSCRNISLQGDVYGGPTAYLGGNLATGACVNFTNNLVKH